MHLKKTLCAACVAFGCSSAGGNTTNMLPIQGFGGTGVTPSATAGTGVTPNMSAGTGALGTGGKPPVTNTAGTGAAGKAGTGAGGMSGTSGAAGAAGSAAAGSGAAGSAGSTSTGGYIREDAPTEASAKMMGKFKVMMYADGFSGVGQDYGGATIYYPTDADPPFAMDAVVPGFTAYQNSIADWGPFLASHGIVTMTIDTLTTSDPPAQRADELMGALKALAAENTRMGSPLMGKLDLTRQAVSGWSMGGGGTLIASAAHPELKCGVSFAAWQPSGGEMDKVPVLMFEATADPLAAGMSDSFYTAVPDSVDKMLFEVAGAGHDVANSPFNSMSIIGLYGLSWFKVYLEGDMRYKQFLLLPAPSITSTFMTNVK
jgi:dienelactone hydrolase